MFKELSLKQKVFGRLESDFNLSVCSIVIEINALHFRTLPTNAWELALAVRNDEELDNLLCCLTIAQGSMLSNIHQVLLQQKKKKLRGKITSFAFEKKQENLTGSLFTQKITFFIGALKNFQPETLLWDYYKTSLVKYLR